MKLTATELQSRAKKLHRLQLEKQADPRFVRVMSRFVTAGLLRSTLKLRTHRQPVRLQDVLFAGTVEPRLLELLPAVLLKKPSLIRLPKNVPEDVQEVTSALRHGKEGPEFRGIPFASYAQWVPRIGHKGKSPTLLKSFRFTHDDLRRLRELKMSLPAKSETEVLRMALKCLETVSSEA